MLKWLTRRRPTEPAPLTGAPLTRRLKLYTAESGYVYEYCYQGYRVSEREPATGAEYVFDVSPDRANWSAVRVFLADDHVAAWERERGCDLNAIERYALVKMALFRAFDRAPRPCDLGDDIEVPATDVSDILETLGLG